MRTLTTINNHKRESTPTGGRRLFDDPIDRHVSTYEALADYLSSQRRRITGPVEATA